MVYFLAKMVLVLMAHFAAGVCLYYQRTTHRSALFDSDVLVFLIPAALAFAGYFLITWSCAFPMRHRAMKITTVTLMALAATAMSSVCTMTFVFNRWGT